MDFWDIWPYIYWSGLVFARVSGLFLALPPFSGRGIPTQIRIGTAAAVALLLVPVLKGKPEPAHTLAVVLIAVARELAVGLGLGFVVSLIFNAIYVAGQLIDLPMGFGMVNVMDPHTGVQVPIFAQFQYILAGLVFITIGGHRTAILALARSFDVVPMGLGPVGIGVVEAGVASFVRMFFIGVSLSLPVAGALLLTDVALGIVARAIPQINVFIVGFPLKIALGLGIMIAAIPIYILALERLFAGDGVVWRYVEQFLRGFGSAGG